MGSYVCGLFFEHVEVHSRGFLGQEHFVCMMWSDARDSRGGAFRTAVPKYNRDSLECRLEKYVKDVGTAQAFNLGLYERLGRSKAVNAKGILACYALIFAILEEVCQAEVNYKDIKFICLNLITKYPELKPKQWGSAESYAGNRGERVITILKHCRTSQT